MSKYDVNYHKLVQLLLPICLRGRRMIALLDTLTAPIGHNHIEALKQFREEQHYRMVHTGQVCWLRGALNDRFDPIMRGITVTDDTTTDTGIVLYQRAMSRHRMIRPRGEGDRSTLYRRGYAAAAGNCFCVCLPTRLSGTTSEAEVKAVVNRFKLAGIRFKVLFNIN